VSFPIEDLPDIPPEWIVEVKDFIRIDHALDDQAIAALLRSAANLCENFIGQMLMIRSVVDMLPGQVQWQKLKRVPVRSINLVEQLASDGATSAIPAGDYDLDIDSDGRGWVRVDSGAVVRLRVSYQAGLALEWEDVPASLQQGIIRLAGFLYANRDGVDAGGPPSAVTALWRPHRRMRLN